MKGKRVRAAEREACQGGEGGPREEQPGPEDKPEFLRVGPVGRPPAARQPVALGRSRNQRDDIHAGGLDRVCIISLVVLCPPPKR